MTTSFRCCDVVQDECDECLCALEDDVDTTADAVEGVDDEGQERIRRLGRGMTEPTAQERLDHAIAHVPYRSWCPHCVRGRGKSSTLSSAVPSVVEWFVGHRCRL